jgi:hypothetical protein
MTNNQEIKCKFYEDLVKSRPLTELAKEFEEEKKNGEEQGQKLPTAYDAGLKRVGGSSISQNMSGFIYVPSIGIYFAKPDLYDWPKKNWQDTHEMLASKRKRDSSLPVRMPTIPEFIEYIKYLRENSGTRFRRNEYWDIFSRIVNKGGNFTSFLDAYFAEENGEMYILTENKTKRELLEDCLMDIRGFVDIDSFNRQGLPTKLSKKQKYVQGENIYYWPLQSGRCAYIYNNVNGHSIAFYGTLGWPKDVTVCFP